MTRNIITTQQKTINLTIKKLYIIHNIKQLIKIKNWIIAHKQWNYIYLIHPHLFIIIANFHLILFLLQILFIRKWVYYTYILFYSISILTFCVRDFDLILRLFLYFFFFFLHHTSLFCFISNICCCCLINTRRFMRAMMIWNNMNVKFDVSILYSISRESWDILWEKLKFTETRI